MDTTEVTQLRKVERVLLCVPCLPLPCPRWLATGSLRRLCSGRGCGARGGGVTVLRVPFHAEYGWSV